MKYGFAEQMLTEGLELALKGLSFKVSRNYSDDEDGEIDILNGVDSSPGVRYSVQIGDNFLCLIKRKKGQRPQFYPDRYTLQSLVEDIEREVLAARPSKNESSEKWLQKMMLVSADKVGVS